MLAADLAPGLRRAWRQPDLRLLFIAVALAITAFSSVAFYAERMTQAITARAAELLAADIVVSSPNPIPDTYRQQAERAGLRTARTLSFRSMLVSGEQFRLAEIKAVGDGYPLRGELRTAAQPYAADASSAHGPRPGNVWLDARLFSAMQVPLGGQLAVGEAQFTVSRILSLEPDRGGDFFTIGPRLMMHLDDVQATGLVVPASRVQHKLLIAGDDGTRVAALRRTLADTLADGEALQSLDNARPELRTALQRAEHFLNLSVLIGIVLAGIAAAGACSRYATAQTQPWALMRSLGATRRQLMLQAGTILLAVAVLASITGIALGLLLHGLLIEALAGITRVSLALLGWQPVLASVAVAVLMLSGVAAPMLLNTTRIAPLRTLRDDLPPPRLHWLAMALPVTASLYVLVAWQVDDTRLIGIVALALSATATLVLLLNLALQWLLGRLPDRVMSFALRTGIRRFARPGLAGQLQGVAVALVLLLILLTGLLRNELLNTWQAQLPAGTPNYFLLNILPAQRDAVQQQLVAHGIEAPGMYPMIRGRLSALNGVPLQADSFVSDRARRLLAREFNLSYAATPQRGNSDVAGAWWRFEESAQPLASVEYGVAQTFGIELGDWLTFTVAGAPLRVQVRHLRQVNWESFDVNFFVVMPPAFMRGQPATWITSLYIPTTQRAVLADVVRDYPNITVMDVDALLGKAQATVDQAVKAIEVVFGFSVLASLLVVIVSLRSSLQTRLRESAVMRALGATAAQLRHALLVELTLTGLSAGLVAASLAALAAHLIARELLALTLYAGSSLWLTGGLAGIAGITVAGWLVLRPVLRQTPLAALQSG